MQARCRGAGGGTGAGQGSRRSRADVGDQMGERAAGCRLQRLPSVSGKSACPTQPAPPATTTLTDDCCQYGACELLAPLLTAAAAWRKQAPEVNASGSKGWSTSSSQDPDRMAAAEG